MVIMSIVKAEVGNLKQVLIGSYWSVCDLDFVSSLTVYWCLAKKAVAYFKNVELWILFGWQVQIKFMIHTIFREIMTHIDTWKNKCHYQLTTTTAKESKDWSQETRLEVY